MSNKKIMSQDQAVSECSQYITNQVFRYLAHKRDMFGEDFFQYLAFDFLTTYIGSLATGSLSFDTDGLSNTKAEKAVEENFVLFKTNLQDSVSAGVQEAMSQFTGQPVEYYCQVKPIPESVNKFPV